MPAFNAVAPRWQFAAAKRTPDRIRTTKATLFSPNSPEDPSSRLLLHVWDSDCRGGQPVPNYKELINSAVKSSFVDRSSVGLVEVSSLHPSRPPQMGDWMACLRVAIKGQPALYAAFIEGQPPSVPC